MGRIIVDGVAIDVPDGQTINILSSEGSIYVGGNVVNSIRSFSGRSEVKIIVKGVIANLDADGSVEAEDITGNVDAGGSVNCRNIGGSVYAGGSVNCGNVSGDIDAGGSVKCASRR